MSTKKSRLDLLVRVRYLNPLPPPPFPPKLLNITTDINRLGEPSYLNELAASTPLPMLVDSEMGMPLDLNAFDGVWEGNDEALNPIPDPIRMLDPADIVLLAPVRPPTVNGIDEKPPTVTDVSWMRNSNMFTRKGAVRRREAAEAKNKAEEVVDASEAAQLLAIEKTFMDVRDQPLEELRHPDPKKKNLRVVDSYDVLPDDEAWANNYIVVRFPERPTAATASDPTASASSPRLGRAMLRPIMSDDQQLMEFYLPQDKDLDRLNQSYINPADLETIEKVTEMNVENGANPEIDDIFPSVYYDRIRTYELVSRSNPKKEVLLTFCDGDETSSRKRKGAFFKEIGVRTLLRKTRAKPANEEDSQEEAWDRVRVGYCSPNEHELAMHESGGLQVRDPRWINEELRKLHGGENQAEGQGEAIDDEELDLDDGATKAEAGGDDDD